MSAIKRHPGMPSGAFSGKFHIVNDRTGFSCQSEVTEVRARAALAVYNDHEHLCECRRAKDPSIPRRDRETYHIEVEG